MSQQPPRAPSAGLSLPKKLLFSAIVTMTLLVLAELSVRAWVYHVREEFERFDAANQTFVLKPGEYRKMGTTVKVNSDGFVGAELEPRTPELWRIVAVGDSNTFGGGDDVNTYPAKLEQLLEQRVSGPLPRYEVVNAGIEGLNSSEALARLRSKVLPLQPDVVTIYIGWNDLMKFDPTGQDANNELAGVSRSLDRLWLVKGMRKLLFFYLRPYTDPPATGAESRTGRFRDFSPSFYIDNLREMVRLVRESGARPLIMTLATSVREDMDVEDLRSAHVYFPYYRSGYGVGDLLDLVAAYNRAVIQVAAAEQVPLLRLDQLFDRPDYRELFFDTMHPTEKGQWLLARALARALDEQDMLGREAVEARTAKR